MFILRRHEDGDAKQKRRPFPTWTCRNCIVFLLSVPLTVGAFATPSTLSASFRFDDRTLSASIRCTYEQRLQLRISQSPVFRRSPLVSRLCESNGGDLILANDKSLLTSAFSGLDDRDKYETVLTGLCSKIIDGGASDEKTGMRDPIRLMEEMNTIGVIASQRSIMALIDATVLSSDARIMAKVLSLSIKNGAIANYGALQAMVTPFPRSSPSVNMFPFGNDKNDQVNQLNNIPPVPDDDRTTEVTSAATFSAVALTCVGFNVFDGLFGFDEITPYTNLFLGLMVTTLIVDNFFDVIVGGGSLIAKMNADKLPESAKKINAPKKEEMPLGLGSGSITGTVVRGLGRLLSTNTERDCQCEAAAFFVAYSVGLPCFSFRPNSLEGAALVLDSMSQGENESEISDIQAELDDLSSDAGLLKVLVWLMAPVAMENSKYPQLISSDPRESEGFLKRLRERSDDMAWTQNNLADVIPCDEVQANNYLRWALAEASVLLRDNKKMVDELTEALAGGAATVGDCVALLEKW